MANCCFVSNLYGSLKSKAASPNCKKVPFRSANPVQLGGTSLNIQPTDYLDGVSALTAHNLMAECTSPVRGHTMKEYDQQIARLENENFNLKLRIFLLEQRIQHKFGDSFDDVHKLNFELQVQVETLKKELATKKELLVKASAALESLESNHKAEMSSLQQQFMEQRKALEQQLLQLQDQPSTHSMSTDESQSHREEFYEQAFLPLQTEPLQTSKEMELESKLKELQRTMDENQSQVLRLQKEIGDRDKIIKEEEVNSLKRNKLLQGLVAAVKTREKELLQLKEKYQRLGKEQASSNEDQSENADEEKVSLAGGSTGSSGGEFQKKNVIEEIKKENERLQSALSEALKQKDAVVDMMQAKLDEQLKEKDAIINRMRESMDHRDAILHECLTLVGISDVGELPQVDVRSIAEAIRLKLDEKENKAQLALEQKIKLLKESENELIQLHARIGELETSQEELKENLERTQQTNMELQEELNQRDVRMKEMLDCLSKLREDLKNTKERHSTVMHEKDSLIQRLEQSFVNSERELQETLLSNAENAGSFSSDCNHLQKSIDERDKLLQELLSDKNKSLVESERSVQSLSASLRKKDSVLKDIHDRLVQEQDVRVKERDQLQMQIDKKSADIRSLENRLQAMREEHEAVITKLKLMLEEKDRTIKNLVETNAQKAKEFETFLSTHRGSNADPAKEVDLRNEIDALNRELNSKQEFILSVQRAVRHLTRKCSSFGTCDGCNTTDDEVAESTLVENIRCLEQNMLNVQQQTQHLKDMFKSANKRVKGLRSLVQKCSGIGNDGAGDALLEEKDDLLENVKELLADVKLMVNHNEMLERHIRSNEKVLVDKRTSIDSQLLVDMASQLQQLKSQLGDDATCVRSGRNVCDESRSSALDSTLLSLQKKLGLSPRMKSALFADTIEDVESRSNAQLMLQLREANDEIQTLKDKLSSTENTVHHLGSKIKEYRKRLAQADSLPLTPSTPTSNQLDVSCFPTPPSCHTDQEDSREAASLTTRRSVSAEDVRSTQTVVQDEQALSVDDVVNAVETGRSKATARDSGSSWRKETGEKDVVTRSPSDRPSCTPFTPDSVNEFGETDDVLELKEQICWLKLRFEEHLHELNEKKNKVLAEPFDRAHATSQTETVAENETVELQYLQQQNSILQMKLDTLLAEIPEGQHASYIQLQRQEILSLRNHLCDSHDACELLRSRLEELAEFLEQLLRFDENGLLDLSQFTPQRIASLQLQIAQSRELSINLSQSLMIDGDLSMISSCVESTRLLDPENVTLTDNDNVSVLANPILISAKSATKRNVEDEVRDQRRNFHADERRNRETEYDHTVAETEAQWKKCSGDARGKQAQSSYDDLILLLDASTQEQFRQIADKKSRFSRPDDVRNLASEQEQAIHEYVRRDSVLQHRLDKVHQSLKENYQLMAGDIGALRSSQEFRRHRAVISPTDSESWSEPDRDVSQQRMGIDPEFLSPGDKGQFARSPRSSRHRSLKSGSSNTEEAVPKPLSGRKPRSDPAESWRQLQIENLEEVNASLRSELEMCHALLKGSGVSLKGKSKSTSGDDKRPVSAPSSRKQLFKNGGGQPDAYRESLEDNWHEMLQRRLGTWVEEEKALEFKRLSLEKPAKVGKDLEKEVQSLQTTVQKLRETIRSKEATIQELRKNLSGPTEAEQQLKETNQRLHGSLSQLQTALKDKDSVCQELRESNVRLQNLLDVVDKLVRERDGQLLSVEKQKEQLAAETEERIQKLQEKVGRLSQLLEDASRSAEEKRDDMLQAHANEMTKIRQEHVEKTEVLSKLLKEREAEIGRTRQLVGELRDRVAEKEESLRVMQTKFDEMSTAIAETERHLEEEHGKHLSLQEKVNALNRATLEKDKSNASLQATVEELESSRVQLEREHASCEAKVGELQANARSCQQELLEKDHQIGMLRQVVDKMQEVILEKKNTLERQLEKARNLEEKVEILSSSATEREQRCQEECAKRHHLQDKLRQAKEAETMAKAQATSHQHSCGQLKDGLAAQERKYLELQNKLDERGNVIRKLEEELHQSWEENERLQQQVVSVQTMLHETNNLNKSMKTELQVYEHLQSSFVTNGSESKEMLRSNHDIGELLQEIRSLRTQLELSIQTSCALRQRLEQQLSGHSSDAFDKHTTALEGPSVKELSSQSTSCSQLEPAGNDQESGSSRQDGSGRRLWGEKLQQSQHFSKISSNSIESGQFSDIDADKQGAETHPDLKKLPNKDDQGTTETKAKTVARKKRPTNLVISKQGCMSGTMDLSAGTNDLHSVYSSPDLGIESDPSHFTYLEQRMSMITDKHLWEIRTKSNSLDKGLEKDDLYQCNGSGDVQIQSDHQLLYAIGRLDDYELLKKEMDDMAKLLNQVHICVKDHVRFAMTTSPVKDVQQVTWKDVQVSIGNISTCLQKSLTIVGSFWTAVLPSENGISEAEFEKVMQMNTNLRRKLRQQKKSLQEALQKLAASNRFKEGMEKAIMKQLSKTHEVLKKAKGNLEDHTKSPSKLS